MEKVFLEILNRGIAAGWLVLAVVVLRLIFRKAPKKYFVILWALVGLRLLIPFSVQSVLSLVPSTRTVSQEALTADEPAIQSGITAVDRLINPVIGTALAPRSGSSTGAASTQTPAQKLTSAAAVVWAAGAAAMLLYALFSWLHIHLKVRASQTVEGRIRICDYVDSPFILGVIRPVIYLPSAMIEEDRPYVIAHEKAHLARRDHLWKPLGFLMLAVFWFNPLLWAAYILLCRDIEYACDEKVLAQYGESEKKTYASALLDCSIPHRMIAAAPLAFGETGVKSRIKNVLRYHKVKAGIIIAAVILCIAAAVCFLTDPVKKQISIPKEEVAYIEYDSHDSGKKTFRARYEDAAQQIDALIGELNGDYTYVKKNWSFRHWNTSGYGVDSLRFYKADGTLLEEVKFINDGYVLESAFLGEREYKNVNGILSTETIRACFADGPWNKYEMSTQVKIEMLISSYCGDLYELASFNSYRTIKRGDYGSIQGYITAKVIQARGLSAAEEYAPGIRNVDVWEAKIHSLQPDTDDPQTVEADVFSWAYYENDGRKEEWRDRFQFVLEPNGNSFRITDVIPVLGDDFLLIEDQLRALDGFSFSDPTDGDYEKVDELVNTLYSKGGMTPVPVYDVLTGEIRYYVKTQTSGNSDGSYSLVKASLYDTDMNLVEESTDSTYGLCLGSYVIKQDFKAMISDDLKEQMKGTCLYDPIAKTVKLEGLAMLYKLTEDRAAAVDAEAHLMGILNADAEMIVPYEGDKDLYVASVEDNVIVLVDESWEKEVRLDINLLPIGEKEPPDVSQDMQQVIFDYAETIFNSVNESSDAVYSRDDFELMHGYLAAKYYQTMREWYVEKGYPVKDHQVTGVIINRSFALDNDRGKDLLFVEAYITCAYTDPELKTPQHYTRNTEVILERTGEDQYKVVGFNNFGAAYELMEAIDSDSMTVEEKYDYIDAHIRDMVLNDGLLPRDNK